ncbi:hypothetical protein LAZ67_4000640 [Cordylochernes scorpioides]|uniref:Reverse transcriptase domain-containing protein n=1 Tax=Cordylochernes scorpioides TaxID=51811 RepID=A0ABY6KEU9_9ARAC|nr:hypothetical protein LAZ67_4000640 [Cordylochernes scorpioides]
MLKLLKRYPRMEKFLKRIQLGNESVSEYLRELRHLAMDCTFGEMLEVVLRDRFVAGIKSEGLQKKLLQEDDDVTLDRVISIAVSFELAEQNAKELQDGLVAKMDIAPGGNGKSEALRGWQHGPDMSGVACYIDDILVAGKDHRDHEQKLELVFKRLQEKGLRLNKDKCKFAHKRTLQNQNRALLLRLSLSLCAVQDRSDPEDRQTGCTTIKRGDVL